MAINFGKKKLVSKPVQEQIQLAEPEVAVILKPKAVPATQSLVSEVSMKIDRAVELKPLVDEAAPNVKEFGALKKDLQLIADEEGDPAQPVTLTSETGNKVIYSAKKATSSLDAEGKEAIIGLFKDLIKAKTMTYHNLMDLLGISKDDVEKYLGADVVAKYYKTVANSGPRMLTAVVKAEE